MRKDVFDNMAALSANPDIMSKLSEEQKRFVDKVSYDITSNLFTQRIYYWVIFWKYMEHIFNQLLFPYTSTLIQRAYEYIIAIANPIDSTNSQLLSENGMVSSKYFLI